MTFTILTIFPEICNSYFNESIIKRAQDKGIIKINAINLRDFTSNKHKTVDDKPYGGGAGMIMKIKPIYKALEGGWDSSFPQYCGKGVKGREKKRTIILTPAGKKFNQKTAKRLSKYGELIFICGRYEGIDARIEKFADEKISIGDFVLTGGELGAMVIIDSITRLLPGVLGNVESSTDESHSIEGVLEYPQYTRPEIFETVDGKKLRVPKVLLSGNHKKIAEWRISKKQKIKKKSHRKNNQWL
ncbi:tRNA (guanosine(37)-N1)-methyltransferase TrmD [Candidatus Falkowbacteria bacterium RBG_13_39_14]|uniref:tRNA (guanine-N(1)-)-methyltransferase n=1 Tax=Candidatus Falkowbacteria bacterium RBG_13_39_14 TaxID=1797985 RepID=A0A1F5S469_9BACT|nr:MAG: tRNA (guanosine(37)-N1)-methyltransferase TrmD [Candidatus Falkowbacteria bacterium RBG_13_39_14]